MLDLTLVSISAVTTLFRCFTVGSHWVKILRMKDISLLGKDILRIRHTSQASLVLSHQLQPLP
jgi:hypothetical protein